MKHFFAPLLLVALLSPACSILKKKEVAPDKPAVHTVARSAEGDKFQKYIVQYKNIAVLEMQRTGIPASIMLGQGILEGNAGESELATNANNHFGIKCSNSWAGPTYKKIDDEKDEKGKPIESCFRKYARAEDSYYDLGEFLRDPKKYYRYGFLFALDRTDYKGWARGLESAGYASSTTYAEQLIDVIERYKLYEFDTPAGANEPNFPPDPDRQRTSTTGAEIPVPTAQNRIGRINDTKVVLTREGETIADVAKAYRLSASKVADYNDRGYTPIQKLSANTRIFIQGKKDKWRGRASEHHVKDKETMFEISQMYGLKLDKLLERNGLRPGQEPATGERIRLKGKGKPSVAVKLRQDATDPTPNQPDNTWPVAPTTDKMNPDEGGLLPEITGGEQSTTTAPQKPPVAPNSVTPPPATNPPISVTGGNNYPPTDPVPNQTGGWQSNPTTSPTVADGYHLVMKGDTLFSISRKYNITVARLKYLNNMNDDNIKIGQTLRVR